MSNMALAGRDRQGNYRVIFEGTITTFLSEGGDVKSAPFRDLHPGYGYGPLDVEWADGSPSVTPIELALDAGRSEVS